MAQLYSVGKVTITIQEALHEGTLMLEGTTILVDSPMLEETIIDQKRTFYTDSPNGAGNNQASTAANFAGKGSEGNRSTIPMSACMISCVVNSEVLAKWIVDSGASSHMVHSLNLLINPKLLANNKGGTVQLLTAVKVHISHIGSSYIIQGHRISNVLYIPDFIYNLLSELSSGQVKGIGREDDRLYVLYSGDVSTTGFQVPSKVPIPLVPQAPPTTNMIKTYRIMDVALWHKRLGHTPEKTLRNILYFRTMNAIILLNLVLVPTYDGKKYFLTLVDDYSRYSWIFLLPTKVEVIVALRSFLLMIQNAYSASVKIFRMELYRGDTAYDKCLACLGYVTDVWKSDKFAPRAVPVVFLGYSMTQKGYKMCDVHFRIFTVSRDVVFKEDVFSFKYAHTTSSIFPVLDLTSTILSYPENKLLSQHTSPTNSSSGDEIPLNNTTSETTIHTCDSSAVGDLDISVPIPAEPSLPLSPPLPTAEPPLTFKDPKWIAAMKNEILALEENNTWSIVALPPGKCPLAANGSLRLGSSPSLILQIRNDLKLKFKMKDLGLSGAKPAGTPLETSSKLIYVKFDSFMNKDSSNEANAEGKELENFMHRYKLSHMDAALRVVRHIKIAPGLGLLMPSEGSEKLKAYCDSDWGGCLQTRRSVTGYS
ncbi:uncharacterized protein LOC142180694 [Nicotiana tabacum]|uniref:Uncharacterized protein LOC142180694 n=1 Tax=Nicotiana tabacum TaxID=4097 RepID=A0AC58UH79_TOBAC